MRTKLILSIALISLSFFSLKSQPVVRMLFFNLKYEVNSPEAREFLEGMYVLEEIPGLVEMQVLKVRSQKFEFDYALRLLFEDEKGVDQYVKHPIHNDYVANEWKHNVTKGVLLDLLVPDPENVRSDSEQ